MKTRGRRNHNVQPLQQTQQKANTQQILQIQIKHQSLLIQTLGLWCSSSHVLLKQSWRSPEITLRWYPWNYFQSLVQIAAISLNELRTWICRIQSQSLTWHNMTWYHPKAWLSYCCIWHLIFLFEENIDLPASHRIVWILALECIWPILRWNTQIPIARKPTVPWIKTLTVQQLDSRPLTWNP